MRLVLVLIGVLYLSCRDSTGTHDSGIGTDTVVRADTPVHKNNSLPSRIVPIIASAGAIDTIISFSVEGLSAEGSEIKVHYFNDSIANAQWDIFGESGKIAITYTFQKDGGILASEKRYSYQKQLSAINSLNDIKLTDSLNYSLDSNGTLKTAVAKQITDVYTEFKANVPLVLKK